MKVAFVLGTSTGGTARQRNSQLPLRSKSSDRAILAIA